jgi:hypothetical protein
MPVPDQVRDDGSGSQFRNILKGRWIPGQARNDKSEEGAILSNSKHAVKCKHIKSIFSNDMVYP